MSVKLPDNYIERPMAEELDLPSRIHGRFKGSGLVMPFSQRNIYKNLTKFFVEDVKTYRGFPKTIHKPSVVDVGCGCGIGANIMSQEAQFVWGIDTNKESIQYATEMFERQPNNIYYTPQLTFDVVDVNDEPREMMQFDYVVCIEVIEHIPSQSAENLLKFLNRLVKKDKQRQYLTDTSRTKIFLSTPNRNSPKIQKDTPLNEHHCYEATAGEMYEFLTKHYEYVTVYNENLDLCDLGTEDTPLLFKLENPLQ
jgi:2-polyprenyl-3-methyl-5-hydroxy-6-metoxy-1,4-benzoquinol methylase